MQFVKFVFHYRHTCSSRWWENWTDNRRNYQIARSRQVFYNILIVSV